MQEPHTRGQSSPGSLQSGQHLCWREEWLLLDDIAAKTGFMVTEKGERAFQGTFYAARFLLNERDFCFFGEAIAEPKNQKSSSFKRNQAA